MKRKTSQPAITAMVILVLLLTIPSRIGASESVHGAYESVALPDLIDKASAYDGKRIEIAGEAIGDKLSRSNGVWVAVLADGTALGVFISASDATVISMLGSYALTGDLVRIRGSFHRACPEHGGDLDLHADSVIKLADGRAKPHLVTPGRAFWAAALCLSGAMLSALWRLHERRRKNA